MNTMNSKLFVFSRNEVVLIFAIVLSLTITSFTLGVKFGKRYYSQLGGIQQQDFQEVELKSVEEERVNEVMGESAASAPGMDTGENRSDDTDLMHERLKQKISNELEEKKETSVNGDSAGAKTSGGDTLDNLHDKGTHAVVDKQEVLENVSDKLPVKDQYSGKYTIQLGSHRSIKDAEDFANGFKIRGYNPIVNEVQLKQTGTWYRVSLGVFDTVSEAKEYVLKEKSLFEGTDYVFVKFE